MHVRIYVDLNVSHESEVSAALQELAGSNDLSEIVANADYDFYADGEWQT